MDHGHSAHHVSSGAYASLLDIIRNDPNFGLKHPGVPDSSDGSDGTSYALRENYTLPVAQLMGGVAYVPP